MKLTTRRLVLKAPAAEDVPSIVALANDWRVAEMTLMPHPFLQRDALAWLARSKETWSTHGIGPFAIFTGTGAAFVGAIGLRPLDDPGAASAGYWLSPTVWGRGFATEALGAVLRFGFETAGLARIQATHDVRNAASGRVMEKAGFAHPRTLDLPDREGTGTVPGIIRHLTAAEWRRIPAIP